MRALLHHVNDSLDVLHEAIVSSRIGAGYAHPASVRAGINRGRSSDAGFTGGRSTDERFTGGRSTDAGFAGGRSSDGRFTGGRSTDERFTGGRSTDAGFTNAGSTVGRSLVHGDPPVDVVAAFRTRAGRLLGAWAAGAASHRVIAVGGVPLAANLVACTGAVEVAVHGWDIAQACGQRRPIPSLLAAEMLEICAVILTGFSRRPLFAAPVEVSPHSSPSDRLIAFLGRDPGYRCE